MYWDLVKNLGPALGLIIGTILVVAFNPKVAHVEEENVGAGTHRIYKGEQWSWTAIFDFIGGLMVLIFLPLTLLLSVDSNTYHQARKHAGKQDVVPHVAPFADASCNFTTGEVTWVAPDNALWVIVTIVKGDSLESFPFYPTDNPPRGFVDKVKTANEVRIHYGTFNGPSTDAIFKNPSALVAPVAGPMVLAPVPALAIAA